MPGAGELVQRQLLDERVERRSTVAAAGVRVLQRDVERRTAGVAGIDLGRVGRRAERDAQGERRQHREYFADPEKAPQRGLLSLPRGESLASVAPMQRMNGAAQESNLPSVGLRRRTGFEDDAPLA